MSGAFLSAPSGGPSFQEDFSTYEIYVYTSDKDKGDNVERKVALSLSGAGITTAPLPLDNRYEVLQKPSLSLCALFLMCFSCITTQKQTRCWLVLLIVSTVRQGAQELCQGAH